MEALRVIYAIWLREVKLFGREPVRLVGMIGQPLLYLLLVGQGIASGLTLNQAPSGVGYLLFIYPGIIGMSVLFTSMFSAISIIWDREFGFLKEILVAPVARSSIVLGKVAGGATVAAIQAVILLLLAPLAGVRLGPLAVVQIALVLLLVAAALTSLGLAIASRMATMEGFQVIMNFLVVPMWLLSGAFFPLRGLPWWMDALVRIDPLTYAVDALRGVVYGASPLGAALVLHPLRVDLAVVALALGASFALAIATFRSRED